MSEKIRHLADALLPPEMAKLAEEIGEKKAKLDTISTFVLAVLAGAFIAWGCVFYTVVITHGETNFPYGIRQFVGGIAFCLGLVLVIVGGAELFTGNNLIVVAWANRRISTARLLRNWSIVYLGNFVGAIGNAAIVVLSGFGAHAGGTVGDTMLTIASGKCELSFSQAFFAGIACNTLVCLAVWLSLSASSVSDKVLAIVFPITAFVATGMEHCVANMYFVPACMLQCYLEGKVLPMNITLETFLLGNLLPVSLGNVVGGSMLVGLVYWFVYLRPKGTPDDKGR